MDSFMRPFGIVVKIALIFWFAFTVWDNFKWSEAFARHFQRMDWQDYAFNHTLIKIKWKLNKKWQNKFHLYKRNKDFFFGQRIKEWEDNFYENLERKLK